MFSKTTKTIGTFIAMIMLILILIGIYLNYISFNIGSMFDMTSERWGFVFYWGWAFIFGIALFGLVAMLLWKKRDSSVKRVIIALTILGMFLSVLWLLTMKFFTIRP